MSNQWGPDLVGLSVKIMVGEPWDFQSSAGQNRLHGVIEDLGGTGNREWVLLRVTPFTHEGVKIRHLLASIRHVGASLSREMMVEKATSVNLTFDRGGEFRPDVLVLAKANSPAADVGWLIGSIRPPDELTPKPEDI